MSWAEVLKSLCFWGPGALIAGVLIFAVYRLADKFIDKGISGVMDLGCQFIAAQQAQAASLAKMAQGTEGLRDCINNFVNRDNQEHREIIILLKYTRDQLNGMTESVDAIADDIKELKEHKT